MSAGPRALVVTSVGSPGSAVTPVLAALEVAGVDARAIDVGRVGSRSEGTMGRMVRAVVGEIAERRLLRELAGNPPDVAIAFDPGSATALSAARDEAVRPAPVLAVVPELSPGKLWGASGADRYLVVDDEAAVALSDCGIDGHRILPVGPLCEVAYVDVARESRETLRGKFKIPSADPVVLVEVEGLGYEVASQVALQLSLTETAATYLFAAGADVDAATALRQQVPTLDMRAKLFGETKDAPRLWRCADVVVARPRAPAVARVLALGARMVAFLPEDKKGEALARELEERKLGATASSALMISSALDPLLRAGSLSGSQRIGSDGAANAADVAWVVGRQRQAVLDEDRAAERERTSARVASASAAAEAASRSSRAPGDLEDLSGGFEAPRDAPDPAEIARLKAELGARLDRLNRTVADAHRRAEDWQKRRESAAAKGQESVAREAERNADLERARMHSALAELAQTKSELERLDEAARQPRPRTPPRSASGGAKSRSGGGSSQTRASAGSRQSSQKSVDELLEQLKRQQGKSGEKGGGSSSVDDELAALKRKMDAKKRGKS